MMDLTKIFGPFGGFIIDRLSEPSTYAGGSLLALSIHSIFPGAMGDAVTTAIASFGAIVAMIAKEHKAS
jgi:hypothetical protein